MYRLKGCYHTQPGYRPAAPHGAAVEINVDYRPSVDSVSCIMPTVITHRNARELKSTDAKVVSYKDGMVIGCTFVSNDAMEKIWWYHQQYLTNKDSGLAHQEGK